MHVRSKVYNCISGQHCIFNISIKLIVNGQVFAPYGLTALYLMEAPDAETANPTAGGYHPQGTTCIEHAC